MTTVELNRQKTAIRLLDTPSVFDTPERVARDLGLFEKHGVEVTFNPRPTTGPSSAASLLPDFNQGALDTWAMCEWGAIHRAERFDERPGHIVYLRATVASQTMVSFLDDVQGPQDLAHRPVGILETTGQHYNSLLILEGPLRREEIVLEARSNPSELLEAARSGELAAATLMEPLISLALLEGAHLVAVNFFRGAAIVADDVPRESVKRFVAAINEAVDAINLDRDAYRHYVTEGYPIDPSDLRPDFHRFVHASPYPKSRFDASYEWMKGWELAIGNKSYEEMIDPTIVRA
jgi:NitT/TauT family transport system substrate-binding protein